MTGLEDTARSPGPGLREAINEAYSVFGTYRRAKPLNVCRCASCVTPEEEKLLGTNRLADLPAQVLAAYTRSAHEYDPVLDGETFRHFLPRYFDLIAQGQAPDSFGDVHFCLSRLALTHFRDEWPRQEVDVIDRFFDEIILHSLGDHRISHVPAGPCLTLRAQDVFVMAATAGGDPARLVALLDKAPDPACALHVATMAENVAFESGAYTFKTPLLDAETPMARALGSAIATPKMLQRLETAFLSASNRDVQDILGKGIDYLATWCGGGDADDRPAH